MEQERGRTDRNRERKMLVLYKTVKFPLSHHGLGELPESMETFCVCLCCRFFSLGPHEATEYLKCAYCHWGMAFLILFHFIASGIALGSAGRRLNVSKDWRHVRLPPEKGASSLGGYGGPGRMSVLRPFFFFNWSIVNLQCCVSFKCTAKGFSYTYIYSFSDSFPL